MDRWMNKSGLNYTGKEILRYLCDNCVINSVVGVTL